MAIVLVNTIKNWFKTGSKPTQEQFGDVWDSFRHKLEGVPAADVDGLDELLLTKASQADVDNLTTLINGIDGATLPSFGTFTRIMRGSNHNSPVPIAGDIFQGVISQEGEPLVVSNTLKWNGIGPLNNTNLANFNIASSNEWEQPSLRSATITAVNATSPNRGVCGAAETEMVYWMGLHDFIKEGDTLYQDQAMTILKVAGEYASAGRNGVVDANGVMGGMGDCA